MAASPPPSPPLPPSAAHLSTSGTKHPPWYPTVDLLSRYPNLYVLACCTTMKHLHQIHAHTITTGLIHDNFVASRLLSFCALSPSKDLSYALRLFHRIHKPDIFIRNILIRSESPQEALLFFARMLEESIPPDVHTIPLVLKACAETRALFEGRSVHALVIKSHPFSQARSVLNFLVYMYAECGLIDIAREVFDRTENLDDASWNIMVGAYASFRLLNMARYLFDEMPQRGAVSWSVMINGYMKNGCLKEALDLFRSMLAEKNKPNESMLVNMLSACAHLGALSQGEWISTYVKRKDVRLTVRLGTALIDMYSKCGSIRKAFEVFQQMEEKNVMTWSAMIMGFATNGFGVEALDLFKQMKMEGVRPNEVTFVGVLDACSHSALVDEGRSCFESMGKEFGIDANVYHYCCMVDLYGRAGLLTEAEDLIQNMPIKPNSAVWGALLGACRIHQNLELGELVAKQLIELEPHHSGRYVLLSNLYSAVGRWEDVGKIRRLMKERGVKKMPGWSYIELNGKVHKFIAGDNSHPQARMIYEKLGKITEELKLAGYKPNTDKLLLDMDEEHKENALYLHSEK